MHFLRNLSLFVVALVTLAAGSPAVSTNEDLIYIRIPGHDGSADQTVGVPYIKNEEGKSVIDVEEFHARMRAQHDDLYATPKVEKEVKTGGYVQYHENGDLDTFTLDFDLGPEDYDIPERKEL
ncbi:hypothetical protein JCM5353_005889 [Sporobolomyces roseus]